MDKGDTFTVDFIGVGFPRCGTTWISKCLAEHPGIAFSNKKEVHFFNTDFDYQQGIEHYKTFFPERGVGQVMGEFTPEYFMYSKTRERILQAMPNAKLIFSVRNPIERAFSHYLYRKRKTGVAYDINEIFNQNHLPFEEQILAHGFYYKHLVQWIEGLSDDQYLIVVHDDAKHDPQSFISNVYSFLGVDPAFVPPSLRQEVNKSKDLQYRFRWIQNLYAYRTKIKRSHIGRIMVELLKRVGLSKVVAWVIAKNFVQGSKQEVEELDPVIREKIYQVYKDDIAGLEQLINRDFSFWK